MAEALSQEKLSEWVTAGGYPEAIKRRSERRRQDWYRAYIKSIVERDLPEISNLAKPDQIPRVQQIAAQFAGQLTNLSGTGRSVGLDHKTADHYVRVLEQLYLVQRLFHYRDRDQLEVDFVLENAAGEIVGIEVKSAASVTRRDFLGLERVASAAGSTFKQGIVLYDGVQTLSFAENPRAVPLSALSA